MIGLIGDYQASQIGDVLAQGQLAVDVQAWQRFKRIVLLGQGSSASIEVFAIGFGPPIA